MGALCILLLSTIFFATKSGAETCQPGWTHYKNGLCLKFVEELLAYDDARNYCSNKENASPVVIKDSDFQLFLTSGKKMSDNIWLDGKYETDQGAFMWGDGSPITYTDWEMGYPKNVNSSGYCIELNPMHDDTLSINNRGKWSNANCSKLNLVICQQTLQFTLMNEMENLRKSLRALQTKTDVLQNHLEIVSARVVPVGSIYVEYYNQPSPASLWPDLTWQDITSAYSGLFFRATGGDAGSWGTRQTACAPRITKMEYSAWSDGSHTINPITIPESGPSPYGHSGHYYYGNGGTIAYEGLRFTTSGCEVRPVNQAIRIWKRIA